ncbi:MAG: hypothetical protein A3G23_13580 [Bacteroidetes bacterium RIFCSPLOWO2_12_FULL_37_12]|nr:MAG: hypothetical protein A3G23_13580 [Bacteroidetes bacterium RIFCSPLOWO2_12_FULL_37_12]
MTKNKIYITLLLLTFLIIGGWLLLSSDYRKLLYPDQSADINKIEIDSSAVKDIEENIDTIIKWAELYKISPEAIMGVIIAERSLHKSPANQFEEYYVQKVFLEKSDLYLEQLAEATKNKIENKKLTGESEQEFKFRLQHGLIWTIGLCQISIMKSLEIDSLLSLVENRSKRTVKENIKCLMTPNCSIEYCAFELKTIRDNFKSGTGIDISNNNGVLCTLYNTGKVSESISKYNKTKSTPQPNIFGKYVELKSGLLSGKLKQHHDNKANI